MARYFWIAGAVNGFLAVALGAFAAHGLKARLEPRMFEVFEVGARYHMYHALALLAAAAILARHPSQIGGAAGVCFLFGIVLFSGSLYGLAMTGIGKLGIITPFGGTLFLIGWVCLAIAGARALRG